MMQRQLDAFAAHDPEATNRFVAVLLIPDVQLLAVSAEYAEPAELQALLAHSSYRDVYAALFTFPIPGCAAPSRNSRGSTAPS